MVFWTKLANFVRIRIANIVIGLLFLFRVNQTSRQTQHRVLCVQNIFDCILHKYFFLHVGQKYLRAMGPKLPCLASSHSAALAGTLHHIGDPDKIGIVQYKDFI